MGESKTVHSVLVTYISMISLLTFCPPFVILPWYTMFHADGSVLQTCKNLKRHGLQGFKNIYIWPPPSPVAWKIIGCFGAFEAFLQLALPGKIYLSTRSGIFDPAVVVYDHWEKFMQHLL